MAPAFDREIHQPNNGLQCLVEVDLEETEKRAVDVQMRVPAMTIFQIEFPSFTPVTAPADGVPRTDQRGQKNLARDDRTSYSQWEQRTGVENAFSEVVVNPSARAIGPR